MRINAHAHLLPDPRQIPHFMREKKIFWIDADRRFMRQEDWKRPITDPSFFLHEKIEWMQRVGVDHAVVLTLSQLYGNGLAKSLARDVARFQNDFNAGVQAEHPDLFTGGFVVQPAWTDDALAEIERCVSTLGLRVLCLPTHFQGATGQWHSIAHPSVEAIFQLADHHELAVEIHPYDAEKIVSLADDNWRFHLVWMLAQTADAYHQFTLRGFPERFPRVRTCFAHGNQFGQVNTGRRTQGFLGRPDLFPGMTAPDASIGARNVFFDTLVHDVLSFELLVNRQGISQIVAGLDDPYPLGEMDSVPGCWPGKILDEAVELGIVSAAERREIWFGNVLRWLGK